MVGPRARKPQEYVLVVVQVSRTIFVIAVPVNFCFVFLPWCTKRESMMGFRNRLKGGGGVAVPKPIRGKKPGKRREEMRCPQVFQKQNAEYLLCGRLTAGAVVVGGRVCFSK